MISKLTFEGSCGVLCVPERSYRICIGGGDGPTVGDVNETGRFCTNLRTGYEDATPPKFRKPLGRA